MRRGTVLTRSEGAGVSVLDGLGFGEGFVGSVQLSRIEVPPGLVLWLFTLCTRLRVGGMDNSAAVSIMLQKAV